MALDQKYSNSPQEGTTDREQCLGVIQFYQETKMIGIRPLGLLSSSLSAPPALRNKSPMAQSRENKGPSKCTLKARGARSGDTLAITIRTLLGARFLP